MKRITAILTAAAVFLLTGCAGGVHLNFSGVSPFRNIRDGGKIAAIDSAVADFQNESGVTGLSVGVIDGKETRFVSAGGMDEHTKVEIGTMTQMFTGMLIGNFEANKWLDRQQVVSDWFQSPARVPVWLPADAAEGERGTAVQVWQLATHTSGLGAFDTFGKAYATGGMLHNQLDGAALAFEPGTQQADSTLGYALLCETLRQCYNMNAKYTNLVNNQIIVKMDLQNSAFVREDALAGYDGYQSTAYDLTKVVGYCTGALVADEMLTGNIAAALEEVEGLGRSLAFDMDTEDGRTVYYKTGSGDGTVSCIAFIPELQTGVAINAAGSADLMPLARALLEAVR